MIHVACWNEACFDEMEGLGYTSNHGVFAMILSAYDNAIANNIS
jgi:hypothetical protein